MNTVPRRRFLKNASQSAMALGPNSAIGRFGLAEGTPNVTRVVVDSGRETASISERHAIASLSVAQR